MSQRSDSIPQLAVRMDSSSPAVRDGPPPSNGEFTTATLPARTPRRQQHASRSDKENVIVQGNDNIHGIEQSDNDCDVSSTTPARTRSLPSISTNFQSSTSPPSSFSQCNSNNRTPTGTSRLLREHYNQLSHRKHRLLEEGPVRLTPQNMNAMPQQDASPKKRIGYDGTHNTPSNELMKSTVCSRSHQIFPTTSSSSTNSSPQTTRPSDEESSSTDRTISSADQFHPIMLDVTSKTQHDDLPHAFARHSFPSPTKPSPASWNLPMRDRMDCTDPVALTLWNHTHDEWPADPTVSKLSSNWDDIYGGEASLQKIARPIPIMAHRRRHTHHAPGHHSIR